MNRQQDETFEITSEMKGYYEEVKRLLVLSGIAKIWAETDPWTIEEVEVQQFTKEFVNHMDLVKKRSLCKNKKWKAMNEHEKSGFAVLTVLGWLNSRGKRFLEDHYLWPMVDLVLLWIEQRWVEKYVEPEKREAAFLERVSKYRQFQDSNRFERWSWR